jgi:hypothetical protein
MANGAIKLVQRTDGGYSFEALRAKLVYTHGKYRQQKKDSFNKRGVYPVIEATPAMDIFEDALSDFTDFFDDAVSTSES